MSLSSSVTALHDTVASKIDELIHNGLGIEHPSINEKALDLRMFRANGSPDNPYNLEVLFPDNYSVEFVTATLGYNENVNTYYLSSVLDASLKPLCEALDVLEAHGYPPQHTQE
jgi:hypothetical protein